MKRDGKLNVEYSVLSKLIRKKLKEDLESFRRRKMIESAKRKEGLKESRKDLFLFKRTLAGLKYENGNRTCDRTEMEDICREFYTKLFASKVPVEEPQVAKTKWSIFRSLSAKYGLQPSKWKMVKLPV